MKRFWQRTDGLQAELRARRPEPPRALVQALEARLQQARPRRRVPQRAAVAVGLTAALLASFGAFGGLGYAASAVSQVTSVAKVATVVKAAATPTSTPTTTSTTTTAARTTTSTVAASIQYKPAKGCDDPNHVSLPSNICKRP
jgi:hypothetical protein